MNEEELKLYDASLVLTFAAEDIDEADTMIDNVAEELVNKGFNPSSIVIEESVQLIE